VQQLTLRGGKGKEREGKEARARAGYESGGIALLFNIALSATN
jgi:hypothetical protein